MIRLPRDGSMEHITDEVLVVNCGLFYGYSVMPWCNGGHSSDVVNISMKSNCCEHSLNSVSDLDRS